MHWPRLQIYLETDRHALQKRSQGEPPHAIGDIRVIRRCALPSVTKVGSPDQPLWLTCSRFSEPQKRGIRLDDLRSDIVSLRRAQLSDRRLITAAEAINDLTIMPVQRLLAPPSSPSAAMRQPRSAERVRPPNIRTEMSPTASNASAESRPFVPSPPLSPRSATATFSETLSQASSGEIETKHWAGQVFKSLPSTKILDEKNHKTMYAFSC